MLWNATKTILFIHKCGFIYNIRYLNIDIENFSSSSVLSGLNLKVYKNKNKNKSVSTLSETIYKLNEFSLTQIFCFYLQ